MTAARDVGRALMVALSLSIAFAVGSTTSALASPQLKITAPSDGSWSSTSMPLILGLSDDHEDPVIVTLYAGASAEGLPVQIVPTLLVSLEGSWSVVPALPLQDGQYTAIAEQINVETGLGTSPPVSFTVDTTAPSASITSPGALTKNASPKLSGGAGEALGDLPNVSVAIHEGSSLAGIVVAEQTVAINGGTWLYEAPLLKDGTYTAQVRQEDQAGNVGGGIPLTFTVDTTPPKVSISSPGALTGDSTPTLSGNGGTAPGDLPTVLVAVHKGSSIAGAVVAEQLVAVTAGAWSYTTPALTDGTYTAEVFGEDEAGNDGHGVPVTFTVDTTAPAVTVTMPGYGQVLHESQPTFSGAAGTAGGDAETITLRVYADGPKHSEVLTDEVGGLRRSGSSWTTSSSGPRLHNGLYTVVAEQRDAAGNRGLSEAVPFTIETHAPAITLDTPGIDRAGQPVTEANPTFTGTRATGPEDGDTVAVRIYAGPSTTSGSPVETAPAAVKGSSWTTGPVGTLPSGIYTAQAEQRGFIETGFSETVNFTVDADAPQVSITAPAQGGSSTGDAILVAGSAGTLPGDSSSITLRLFAGSDTTERLAQEVPVDVAEGTWSRAFSGLAPGTYTAQAQQGDDVGNSGLSEPVTFTLSAPAVTPSVPTASFRWFPTAPQVGEVVSLLSTSTDPASALVGFSWSLPESGVQIPGGAATQTVFTSPGRHVVRLSVGGTDGGSGSVDEAIVVAAPATPLMQPFPIVRIAGSENRIGAKISLLTVQAPVGAKVVVSCSGKSCPARLVSALASRSKGATGSTVLIAFRRFERSLRAGVRLEIKVSRSGQIGKYTRFSIRKGKLPTRSDSCLSPTGTNPMPCPSS